MIEKEQIVEATAAAEAAERRKRLGAALRAAGIVAGLVILLGLLNAATHGNFLAAGNVRNILRQIAVPTVLAAGQTFVIITAGIDLSVGSLVALTGVLMAGTLLRFNNPAEGFVVALIVGLGAGALAGTINGLPVVKLAIPAFITTLAMMQAARGLAFLYTNGSPIEISNNAFNFAGGGSLFGNLGHLGIPMSVIIMLAVVIVGHYVLTQTRFGRYVFAIGGNEEAARLSGINVASVKLRVYIISGTLAGLAGFLLAARLNSGIPQAGFGLELQSIAAVVVGGTSLMGGRGSMAGTFVGALLIGVLYNLMNLLNVQSYAQDVVLGAVILAAVVLDELRRRYLARA